jgi:hypothetical protein
MKPFTHHTAGPADGPPRTSNTDQINPKQFLKRIERTGFGQFLFFDWRYLDDGQSNPEFELNRPEYAGALDPAGAAELRLRLSSREHAPRALEDYGFRVLRWRELRRHLLQQLLQELNAARSSSTRRRCKNCSNGLPASPVTSSRSTLQSCVVSDSHGLAFSIQVDPFGGIAC